METGGKVKGLPENAYRPLEKDEKYIPYIRPEQIIPEITLRSVLLGVIMAFVFSAAAAFLGLKVAQVFEAAIPIAILAVGIGPLFKRKSTILENVIIQSIGAASGVIVAGAIFTLPAIFILKLDKTIGIDLFKIFIVSLFGGFIGVLFLIPFRKYFVSEMHGEFPFPEATATTEVLVAGEKGGEQASVLVKSMIVGGLYDFAVYSLGLFKEVFTTRVFGWGQQLANKAKMVFKLDVLAAVFGLGYIVGLKYGTIIAAGSFVSWWVFIPLVNFFGGDKIAGLSPELIFSTYVRHIGIGAIAAAGIIGILKSSKVIYQAFGMGIKGIFTKHEENKEDLRTDKDLKMTTIVMGIIIMSLLIFLFFRYFILKSVQAPTTMSLISFATVIIISFLFTSVAARAIAIVGTNPVSGMTLMTLILSSIILAAAGLKGPYGMMAGLLIGGVVCTALSVAGGFITDLKIGYWLGATPWNQERFKFLGILVASLSVGLVILLLNQTYGFSPIKTEKTLKIMENIKKIEITESNLSALKNKLKELKHTLESNSAPRPILKGMDTLLDSKDINTYKTNFETFKTNFENTEPLPAPQANAMAAVIKPLMEKSSSAPWMLYIIGIIFAIIMELIGIPPLAFALGMYIPLELNTPIMLGGFVAYLVKKSTDNKELAAKRHSKGTLIASGFIAGGALIGIVSALLKYVNLEDSIKTGIANKPIGEWLSLVMFILLSVYVYWDSKKVKEEK